MKKFPYSLKELREEDIDLVKVEGVGIVTKDVSGKIFLVLEKEKKAWKKPGQRSTVMETIEEEDNGCLLNSVKRGLKEELGIQVDIGEKVWPMDTILDCYVYDSNKDRVYKVKLYLYEVILTKEQSEEALKFTNGEVGKVRLVDLEDLKYDKVFPLRPGTKEIVFGCGNTFFIIDGEDAEGF